MGYLAEIAHDGPAALRLAGQFRPDIVLLDIGLPVMDGYEVARHLRALPELLPFVLIAVTGYGQETDRCRSRAAGFDGHLVKPLRLEELSEMLDRLRPRLR